MRYMRPRVDLTNCVFGKLTVLRRSTDDKRKWLCRCSCGNEVDVFHGNLQRLNSTTCGCGQREATKRSNTKHGSNKRGLRTPEYRTWLHMKHRCHNKNDYSYANYGGRGITVCKRWRNSFTAFIEDMGEKPSPKHSIERKDNNRGYNPKNCVWATKQEQARNRRSVTTLTIDGIKRTIVAWSELSGVKVATIKQRLHVGRTPKSAVFNPVRKFTQ